MIKNLLELYAQGRANPLIYFPALFCVVVPAMAYVLVRLICLHPSGKKFMLIKGYEIVLKRLLLYGTYAENIMTMKRFASEEEVIPIVIWDDNVKFTAIKPEGVDFEIARIIIKEQAREHARKLRKKHKTILWYVPNNIFARWLDIKAGPLAMKLLDRQESQYMTRAQVLATQKQIESNPVARKQMKKFKEAKAQLKRTALQSGKPVDFQQ